MSELVLQLHTRPDREGQWYVQVMFEGQEVRRMGPYQTEAQAKAVLKAIGSAVVEGMKDAGATEVSVTEGSMH